MTPFILTTTDEVDISRGDLLVRPLNLPTRVNRFEADVCWMQGNALSAGRRYLLIHTTRHLHALVSRVDYRVDVDTLPRHEAESLPVNEIGRVEITTDQPICVDDYRVNPQWAVSCLWI